MTTPSGDALFERDTGGPPRPARARAPRRARSYCMVRLDGRGHITDLPLFGPALFDHPGNDLIGRSIDELFAERSRAAARAAITRFRLADPARQHLRCDDLLWVIRRDRAEIPVRLSMSWGESSRLVVFLRDLRDELRDECASAAWSFAELALTDTVDYEQTLTMAASFAARALACHALVEVGPFAGDQGQLRVASAGAARDGARVLEKHWGPSGLRAFVHLGDAREGPRLIPALNGSCAPEVGSLRAHSAMSVPLVVDRERVGTIVWLSTDAGRLFSPGDLSLAAELGRRAARAIENARLFRKAQLSAKDRRQMTDAVAHELCSAWSAVQRWADERAQDAVFRDTPGAAEALLSATTRIGRLAADLRDIGELEAGRLAVDSSRRASPHRLVSAAVAAARASAEERRIATELEPGLGDVWADEARIGQVFANLIDNAIKFSSRHETITVGAISGEHPAEVEFFVADVGIGIAEHDQPRVFDRGWKANPCDRRGLGLGLTICKGIVESHGGALWAVSRPGRGSRFVFTLRIVGPISKRPRLRLL